jgi:hypothetical protein
MNRTSAAAQGYAEARLHAMYGARLRRVPVSRVDGVKTFDDDLLGEDGAPVAGLEVKLLEQTPRTPENGWIVTRSGGVTQATRARDNGPPRVAAKIREAEKQLRACPVPRVVVLVNDDHLVDEKDLREAFDGHLDYENESGVSYRNVASRDLAAVQRLREVVEGIDLCIWFNWFVTREWGTSRKEGPFFLIVSDAGQDLARRYFGAPDVPRPVRSDQSEG